LRTLGIAAVLAAIAIAGALFGWRHASVDAVAAVRFEARLAESNQSILANRDIETARMVTLHDRDRSGNAKSTFGVEVTFTADGAGKMRRATQEHIGEHLQLMIDGEVVMAPLIRSAISSSAVLSGDYSWEQANRIVDGLLKGKLELRNDR
jgi:preprotein translocase subunit SecD